MKIQCKGNISCWDCMNKNQDAFVCPGWCPTCGAPHESVRPGETQPTCACDQASADSINPQHYQSHPSGIECIQVAEHMNFCLGNALKYIWRAGLKGDAIEDLKKARWYIEREMDRRMK